MASRRERHGHGHGHAAALMTLVLTALGVAAGPVEDSLGDAPVPDPPLPGRGVDPLPFTTLYRQLQELDTPRSESSRGLIVTLDDLDKLQAEQLPPLRYGLPADFDAEEEPVHNLRGLSDYLPSSLVAILPSFSLPSLPTFSLPRLPDFIPGLEFSASVHTPPAHLPHVPSPGEVVRGVTHLLDDVLHRLNRKDDQLLELIKCACPRPARCETLFKELSGRPAESVQVQHASPPAAATEQPAVSLFAELTRPNGGHGPSLGFFVDSHGPHLGRPSGSSSGQADSTSSESHSDVKPIPPPPPPPAPPTPLSSIKSDQPENPTR